MANATFAQDRAEPAIEQAERSERGATTLKTLLAKRGRLLATKQALTKRHQDKLKSIDRVKSGRRSWRRDRQLADLKSESQRIGDELSKVDQSLANIKKRYGSTVKGLHRDIRKELAGGVSVERKRYLRGLQRQFKLPARSRVRAISMPEQGIDLAADPEELREQLSLLKQTETKLIREERRLLARADNLNRSERLFRNNRRGLQFRDLEDDRVSRSAGVRAQEQSRGGQAGGNGALAESDETAPPQTPNDFNGNSDPDQGPSPSPDVGDGDGGDGRIDSPSDASAFSAVDSGMGSLDDATIVLAEVVDGRTKDALVAASRSGDPAQKAKAARLAEQSVRKKRQELKRLRLQIEERLRTMKP